MPTFSKLPVTSFGPELLQLLIDGTRTTITIELAEPGIPHPVAIRRATSLVARLHQLRVAMRRERHGFADLVMRAKCRREGTKAIIEPRDTEFIPAIRRAGVVPTHEEPVPAPAPEGEKEEGRSEELFDLSKSQPPLDQAIENFLDSISLKERG